MKEEVSAIVSRDGNYRYTLSRVWDKSKPLVMFICLNPSTMDERNDDPTVRRIKGYAKDWGFGGFYICNLFAYKSTKFMPLTTLGKDLAIGKHNNKWLKRIAKKCKTTVFAWGINGKTYRRCDELISMFPQAMVIELSKEGYPKHPLYLNGDLKLTKYKQR